MKTMPGKMLIADSIFKAGTNADQKDEEGMFSIPNSNDPEELRAFKSHARAWHETFNGRLKNFEILKQTFKSVDVEKHGMAFRAISVIVQYQMDNGSPIFELNWTSQQTHARNLPVYLDRLGAPSNTMINKTRKAVGKG